MGKKTDKRFNNWWGSAATTPIAQMAANDSLTMAQEASIKEVCKKAFLFGIRVGNETQAPGSTNSEK